MEPRPVEHEVVGEGPPVVLLAAGIPNARKEVVPRAAHMRPLERPDELDRLLLEFLA